MPVAMQALLYHQLQDLRSNGQYDTRTPRNTNFLLSTTEGLTSVHEPMINTTMEGETQNLPTSPYLHTIARCLQGTHAGTGTVKLTVWVSTTCLSVYHNNTEYDLSGSSGTVHNRKQNTANKIVGMWIASVGTRSRREQCDNGVDDLIHRLDCQTVGLEAEKQHTVANEEDEKITFEIAGVPQR